MIYMYIPSLITLSNKSTFIIYPHVIRTDVVVLCPYIKYYFKSAKFNSSLQANSRSDGL
jgi:hypothetical protein